MRATRRMSRGAGADSTTLQNCINLSLTSVLRGRLMLSRRQFGYLAYAGIGAVALRSMLARADMPSQRTAVDFEVPPNSCDCHVHVFDPAIQPYAERRIYTPPTATID